MAKFFEEEQAKQSDDSLEQLEKECAEELDEIAQGFRDRVKKEDKRFLDVCDSEFYFCCCFTNREQKEEFLSALGLNPDDRYIDGRELARKINKQLKAPDTEAHKTRAFDRDFIDLVR